MAKYILEKQGVHIKVFAQVQPSGDVFWKANRKNATEFNLTKGFKIARQLAKQEPFNAPRLIELKEF